MTKIAQNNANLSKKTSIVGLDIGNALLKSSTGVILDAKITASEPFATANKLIIDDETYYLGYGDYDATYRKVDKKHYIDMMYGLLAFSTKTVNNIVTLGLPLNQYKTDKNELINMVMQNNKKTVVINDIEKPLVIENCEVFPEGIATLGDDYQGIVVDFGGGSIDCALVVNEGDNRTITTPISLPMGTITLYTDISNILNNKYGLKLGIEEAKRVLERKKLLLDGLEADISPVLKYYEEYLSKIISRLNSNYSLRTEHISLTGGGSNMLYEILEPMYKKAVTIQDKPLLSNANSYYELGLTVFGEE